MEKWRGTRMVQMIRIIALIVMMLIVPTGAFAANTAQQVDFLMSGSLQSDGTANAGGKVYTCDAGTVCGPSTSDPKTTWQDSGKVSAETNPVILDSNGKANIYADGLYKFQIYDSDDVLIETIDNVSYVVALGIVQAQDTLTPSSQTISTTVDTYLCNAQSGAVTTDFSGASAVGNTGKRFTFKKTDNTTNTCTIDPLSSQTINGATTVVLRNQDDITIESDGSNWNEVRGMAWSRAATFYNTVTVYNAATFNAATTFNNATTFNDASTFNNTVSWSKGADVASTNTITLESDGNYFDITGISNIGAINTVGVGTTIKFHFDDALTLIYNATDLVLPGFGNVTTSAGDEYEFTEYASGDWTVTGRIINGSASSPSISVHKDGSGQVVGTSLEIITWSTEEWDTNSNFNNTVGCGSTCNRFTPTVAGKYLLIAQLEFQVVADTNGYQVAIYKNGAAYKIKVARTSGSSNQAIDISAIVDANGTTDYFEVYGTNTNAADTVIGAEEETFFQGSRIGQ